MAIEKDKLISHYSLDIFASIMVVIGLGFVGYTFIIGKHYVIPTVILAVTIILFNVAYFGFKGKLWAKYVLFWMGVLISAHTFFALFWAHKPREIFGDAFLPFYLVICLGFSYKSWKHAKVNKLFRD